MSRWVSRICWASSSRCFLTARLPIWTSSAPPPDRHLQDEKRRVFGGGGSRGPGPFDVGEVTRTDVSQAFQPQPVAGQSCRGPSKSCCQQAAYVRVIGNEPGLLSLPKPRRHIPKSLRLAEVIAAETNPQCWRRSLTSWRRVITSRSCAATCCRRSHSRLPTPICMNQPT